MPSGRGPVPAVRASPHPPRRLSTDPSDTRLDEPGDMDSGTSIIRNRVSGEVGYQTTWLPRPHQWARGATNLGGDRKQLDLSKDGSGSLHPLPSFAARSSAGSLPLIDRKSTRLNSSH